MPSRPPKLHPIVRSSLALALSCALALGPTTAAAATQAAGQQAQQQSSQQSQQQSQQQAQQSMVPPSSPVPANAGQPTQGNPVPQAQPAAKPVVQEAPPPPPARKQDMKRAKEAAKNGARAAESGDWQTSYEAFDDAAHWDASNLDYLQGLAIARAHLVQLRIESAEKAAVSGDMERALRQLREARALDPSNRVVADRLTEMSALDPLRAREVATAPKLEGQVLLEHAPGVATFHLRGTTQSSYEQIAQKFGVDVAFDVEVRERPVRLDLENVDFATATRVLGEATGTFWRPLTKRLFFVAPNTTQKRKDYDASLVRTVVFSASETNDQITEISRLIRDIAGVTRTEIDSNSRTLTLRANPQAMAVATGLIEDLEKPLGELVLEVIVVEMDRTKNQVLGVVPPQTAQIYSIPSNAVQEAQSGLTGLITVLQEIFGQSSSLSGLTSTQIAQLLSSGTIGTSTLIPPLVAFGGGQSTFFATLPGASAQFSDTLSAIHTGRRMLLRAEDGKPATFFVGERFPVSLAQYSASLGSSTGVNIPGAAAANFPVTNYNTGANPDFVSSGEFTTDGFFDMAVANYTDGTVSLYLGNGDGTFQDPTVTNVGKGPAWIATGNFNSGPTAPTPDNDLDMAVANQTSNSISILLGNGDGTFTTGTPLTTGNGPVCVVASDIEALGFPDLIVANKTDNTIEVFHAKGDGTFTALTPFAAGTAPTSIVTDDFNGDGKLDLAVTNSGDNTLEIFLGNGDGTFKPGVKYATGVTPLFVAPGDFNGDGIIDLAVADSGDATATNSVGDAVSIFLGNGDGTFLSSANPRLDFAAGTNPTSIAVADYNVDGRPDLAVTAQGDNSISLLLGIGGGSFSSFVELQLGTSPDSCFTEDFNADGIPDLAVTNNGSNTVSVILNSSSFLGNVAGELGTQFPNAEYIDIGVKVKATPRIHDNDEVTIQFEMSISSLAGTSYNNIPVVNNEELHQTVRVKVNQSAELAQFIAPSSMMNTNGTPYLGEVAHGGLDLAAQTTDQVQNTELLVLVTPRLVALSPRRDNHVIYAGRGSLEGAGAMGFTQQERRSGMQLTPPDQSQQQPPPADQQPQQQQPPADQPQQNPQQPAPNPAQPPIQGAVPQPPDPTQANPPVTNPPGQVSPPNQQ
jgi:type II secretory pathway component GspD/PulD (secretin)